MAETTVEAPGVAAKEVETMVVGVAVMAAPTGGFLVAARAVEMKATVRGAAKMEGLKVAAAVAWLGLATRVVVVVGAMAAETTELEMLETVEATAEVVTGVASAAVEAGWTAAASHPATLLMVTPMMMAPEGAASTAANQVSRQAVAHSLPTTSSRSAAYAKEQSARFSSRLARSLLRCTSLFRRAERAYSRARERERARPGSTRTSPPVLRSRHLSEVESEVIASSAKIGLR